jgi:hypothetical protein
MHHIHKRFTTGQIRTFLKGDCQGILDTPAIAETFWCNLLLTR